MNKPIFFTCPKCGNKVLKVGTEPITLNDFFGAVCSNCDYAITEDDVRTQTIRFADDLMRDLAKKL